MEAERPLNMWKEIKSSALRLFDSFHKHNVFTLSAALAFYTALSLAPLLLITLSAISILGEKSQTHFLNQLRTVFGDQATAAIAIIVKSAHQRPHLGGMAGVVGILILFFSASSVFAQLEFSLNTIFESSSLIKPGLWSLIRRRLLSIGMVISFGFLALVSLIMSAMLSYILTNETQVWQQVNLVVTLIVFSASFALLFKFLPAARMTWTNCFIGGTITALLFSVGKNLIGFYLGHSAVGSAYGAAGSLVVLLSWVFYSSVIVFVGAEITNLVTLKQSPTKRPDNK
jgi:membrane protein